MGIEKNLMIEATDRGWTELEGYVCPDCVEDEYLKDIIRDNACSQECVYCGRKTDEDFAAPLAHLIEAIGNAVFTWFDNPENAGGFWDGEDNNYFGIDAIDIKEVLNSFPLECNQQLFEVIAGSFVNDQWVETAGGSIYGSHPHELMSYAWERFIEIVKHEPRYFFQRTTSDIANEVDDYEVEEQTHYKPENFLPTLGELTKKLRLLDTLQTSETLYRARPKKPGESFDLNAKELGATPSQKAGSGRMNPAGISYMYLSFEQETALAEVCQGDQLVRAAIGQFETKREIKVLDLTNLPEKPSIFDTQRYEELVALFFIDEFVKEITKPVLKDGSEHIEYVPTQVVSEYFASVFQLPDGKLLDGIKYPSAVSSGRHNLVLFPTERSSESMFDQVEFQDGWDYPVCQPE